MAVNHFYFISFLIFKWPCTWKITSRFCHTPSSWIRAKSSPCLKQSIFCRDRFFISTSTEVRCGMCMCGMCMKLMDSILLATPAVIGLVCLVVPDMVSKPSKITLKTVPFLQLWTELALSSPPSMLMSVATRWWLIICVPVRKFLQTWSHKNLLQILWLPVAHWGRGWEHLCHFAVR